MRTASLLAGAFLSLAFAGSSLQAQENKPAAPAAADLSVTVYSSADPAGFDPQQFIAQQRMGHNPQMAWQVPGFGVIKEVRPIEFQQGRNTIRFIDVAEFIDPTTVSFTDVQAPAATSVLDQQFQFDLVNPQKLLEKYIDHEITVLETQGDETERITGKLLSATQGQLVLQTGGGVRITHSTVVELPKLPGGLITRPTLVWQVQTNQAGQRPVRTTYQTSGITWKADYNLTLNADDTQADLGAWVTLLNVSGASYPNAQLKLIAGDVQRIQPPRPMPMMMARQRAATAEMGMDAVGFEEKSFFEYHLYTLPRRADIAQNATQQITLFPTARDVKVQKVMVYYGLPESAEWVIAPDPVMDRNIANQSNKKVDVYIRFKNEQANNLGMPLPKGKVRVYKQDDADGTLEFIGEDLIDHTARDERVLIKLGQAFDVVGERTQTDYQVNVNGKQLTESFRITLRNHKDQPVPVIVKENMFRWLNWKITKSSAEYEKVDARTIHIPVDVPAHGEKVVEYTVQYTW
jgi:hypothetical protein